MNNLMSSRYFYYLVFLNMLSPLVTFMPRVLIGNRCDGAVSSMILAIILGSFFLLLTLFTISKVPGRGLPELLNNGQPPTFLKKLLYGYLGISWYVTGFISLLSLIELLKTFVAPHMSIYLMFGVFLIPVLLGVSSTPKQVLNMLEIVLWVNTPFLLIVFLKAFLSDSISYPDVFEAATYVNQWPSLTLVANATYVFTGYINMLMLNKYFKRPILKWPLAIFLPIGSSILLLSHFAPIAFYGFDGAGSLTFPWVATADALRLELSFIERVLYLFIIFYIGISVVNLILHGNIALEWFSQIFLSSPTEKPNRFYFILLTVLSVPGLSAKYLIDEDHLLILSNIWMIGRIFSEYGVVLLMVWLVRRRKKSGSLDQADL